MSYFSKPAFTGFCTSALLALACTVASVVAQATDISATLSGASEAPPTTSTAVGTLKGSFNKGSNSMRKSY